MISLTIDGIDIWEGYNCGTVEGTLAGLLEPPTAKNVDFTDWPEINGIDPDLATFCLDARSFDVRIHAPSTTVLNSIISVIESNNGAHILGMTGTPLSISARAAAYAFEQIGYAYILKVSFIEDMPSYSGISMAGGIDYDYKFDGVPLGNYGIDVLEGTGDSVFAPSKFKQNLTVKSAFAAGQNYDISGGLKLASKSCVLRLRISQSISNTVNSYYAFLAHITGQGSHVLTAKRKSIVQFQVYYKKGAVRNCYLSNNRLWLEFDIELEQYRGYAGE